MDAIRKYALARLRAELLIGGRGRAAYISRESGISKAHINNMTIPLPTRGMGLPAMTKLAMYWGYSDVLAMREDAAADAARVARAVVTFLSAKPTKPAQTSDSSVRPTRPRKV